VGPSSDQYALGVVLYVCLTKKMPFEAHQNLSLLRAIEVGRFQGPRAHRPEIPAELEAIILRAMHADPTRRFGSVHALGQALSKFASSRGQVEWKNYYFQTPTPDAADGGTAKGIPFPPVVPGDGIPLARSVERTAVLPEAPGATALLAGSEGPQLYISTKLAKPTPSVPETPTPPPPMKSSRWAGVVIAACLLAGGGALAYRRLAPSPAPVSPPASPTTTSPPAAPTISKLVAPTTPSPAPTPSREPARPDPAPAPPTVASPGRDLAARESKKNHPARKKHTPEPDKSSKTTGIDKNGIGIPSN